MTPARDIERTLDAWMAPGPTEMPDRLYLDVLDRIERVPQRRTSRLPVRFPSMTPTIRLAVAAAAALAIGITIGPLVVPSNEIVSQPDASPSPGVGGTQVPPELHGEWLTDFRVIDGLRNESARAVSLTFMPALVETGAGANVGLKSRAAVLPDGNLRVETALAATGCDVGAVGHYAWSITGETTRTLSIEPITDDCPLRAEVMKGTFRSVACNQDNSFTCQDISRAGTYDSVAFEPRATRREPERWRPGGLTFTVPDGWSNPFDERSQVILRTTTGALHERSFPDDWAAGVMVQAQPAALLASALCEDEIQVDPAVGPSATELAAFVRDHPGLLVESETPVTIGGHAGVQLDIDIAPTWTAVCPDWKGAQPFVPLFGDAAMVAGDGTVEGYWWGAGGWQNPGDPFRLILLDLGEGDTVLISVFSTRSDTAERHDVAGQAATVAEAMPVIESFAFAD